MPADPADDVNLSAEQSALKQEAGRRLAEWATNGTGLPASSLYDAVVFFSTGLGDTHSHDAQIGCFVTNGDDDLVRVKLNVDTSLYFDDAAKRLALDAEHVILTANPVLPHSEGEIVLTSADPNVHPSIRLNYYDDPHDMKFMRVVVRRALDIAAHWPGNRRSALCTVRPSWPRSMAMSQMPSQATLFWRISLCIFRARFITGHRPVGSATWSIQTSGRGREEPTRGGY